MVLYGYHSCNEVTLKVVDNFDGLMQGKRNSIINALELHLSILSLPNHKAQWSANRMWFLDNIVWCE